MRLLSICLLSAALADPSLAAELQLQAIEIESITADGQAVLSGPDSSWQILVTGRTADGDTVDVTHQAAFTVDPQGVVSVDRSGVMIPLADGKASVVARVMDLDARFDVHVQHVDVPHTLDFVTDVAPILTRYGCNSGGCHGKKGGQEGFELALLGFEPELDYDRLVKDGDGYRIDLDDPDNSYLLRKATKAEPHTGGQRFEKDSVAYRVLRRWIAQGAQQDGTSDAVVERIEVVPRERILQRDGRQQLSVLAHMSDGTVRDVGRLASFEVNQLDIIKVTPDGLVSPGGTAGVASIMVRYQAHVGVFRAIIPTGEPIDDLPTPRNFVDELVFSQLRRIGIPLSDTCDEGTFIRRATIDIAGRLPTVDELTSFTQDTDSEKFARLITRLVESDDSADYFAGKWAAMPFCDATLDIDARVADAVARLSLAEKISALGTGTGALPSLGLPPYNWWSEATHGISHVRNDETTPYETNFAFPITTAMSFNRSLWRATGAQIGASHPASGHTPFVRSGTRQ